MAGWTATIVLGNTTIAILHSGRAPGKLSLQVLARDGFTALAPPPLRHAHNVTVPGAAAGWVDTIERFGSGKVSTSSSCCVCVSINRYCSCP